MGILDDLKRNSLIETILTTTPEIQMEAETTTTPPPPLSVDPNPTSGFRIVAVAGPLWPIDPDIVYSPEANLSERRAAFEQFEWCNLVEARKAKAKAREKRTTQNNRLEI